MKLKIELSMLNFDLNSPPPTAGQIEEERKRLRGIIKKYKRYRLLSGGAAVASLATGLGILATGGLTASGLSMTSSIKAFQAELAKLTPLPEVDMNRSRDLILLCRQNRESESYRMAVVQQGRHLTVAEADMIEAWVKRDEILKDSETLHSKDPLI